MSLRNIRKVFGGVQLPPPDSDEEYEPSFSKNHAINNFVGLDVSSHSEAESVESVEHTEEEDEQPLPARKKNKKKRKAKVQHDDAAEDEVEWCVRSVNALLGEPAPAPEAGAGAGARAGVLPESGQQLRTRLFTVRQKYLRPEDELDRVFGPYVDDTRKQKKKGRQPNLRSIAPKGFIIETDKIYQKQGLSMDLVEVKDNLKYFVFRHSKYYRSVHRLFLEGIRADTINLEHESMRIMHVEGLLETADRLYHMQSYTEGSRCVETVVSYMQQCAHHQFSVTDMRTRLLYKHRANRAFHVALLKYTHMLTNKACHRTALEVCKLHLNLDPSDPLALLLVADTLAIRARQYDWLVDAVRYWHAERQAAYMYNMLYSYALAHYHIAAKKKEGLEHADLLIQKAMLRFPIIVTFMLKIAGVRNAKLQQSPLFDADGVAGASKQLMGLLKLHARLIWNKFRPRDVERWLLRNVEALADKYDSDPRMQLKAKQYLNERLNWFQAYPPEVRRHLNVLLPLNELIFEGDVPEPTGASHAHPAADPAPRAPDSDQEDVLAPPNIDFDPREARYNPFDDDNSDALVLSPDVFRRESPCSDSPDSD